MVVPILPKNFVVSIFYGSPCNYQENSIFRVCVDPFIPVPTYSQLASSAGLRACPGSLSLKRDKGYRVQGRVALRRRRGYIECRVWTPPAALIEMKIHLTPLPWASQVEGMPS